MTITSPKNPPFTKALFMVGDPRRVALNPPNRAIAGKNR